MVEIKYTNIEPAPSDEEIIKKVVATVLEQEKIKHELDVYVTLTDNEEIHKINKEHRNVDSPTDVLSFPMYEREEIPQLKEDKTDDVEEVLGDIIVSVPKVKEQAKEYGHSYERELAYLVAHGMLHLLGYDHMIEEEKSIMRMHEEMCLDKLNITRDYVSDTPIVSDETKNDLEEENSKDQNEESHEEFDATRVVPKLNEIPKLEETQSIKVDEISENRPEIFREPVQELPKKPSSYSETPHTSSNLIYIVIAFFVTLLLLFAGLGIFMLVSNSSSSKRPIPISGDANGLISGSMSGEESGDEIIEEIVPVYTGPAIFSGDSRSIAFMIDNDVKNAWPHAGLNNAYMIYEAIVEGGSSRLIAFFKLDNIPEHIGPIRSCRHYFLDYVQEHDAIYCHYGQSTQGGEALKSRKISNINGIYDDYCKRISDVDRTWHNAFSVKSKVESIISRKGYRTKQNQDCILSFNQYDTDIVSGDVANFVSCKFPNSSTTFEYDPETKTYLISMKDVPHVDKFTGDRVYAKNILVYEVSNKSLWSLGDTREEDNKKRQEVYNTGSGTGYYITNGKAMKMKWSKPTHASKTKYTDEDGNEIMFNDGITWVELIPTGGSYKITE